VRRSIWIWLAVALFAAGYFVLDVRQRARVDRGIKRHRTDFTVYQAAARALKHGADPYEARNPRGYRYVYPPLLAVLLQPIADWAPEDGALVFYLVSVLALLAAILALRRLAGAWPPVLAAAVVCLGFAHQGFQRGQVTHILLALQVGALVALHARRHALAGLALGFGGALRLTPLLPAAAVGLGLLAAVMATRRAHAPLRFGGGLAGGLALGLVVIPVLWLGGERAAQVGDRWVEVTQQVYAANVDLEGEYHINEWRFKNQAPRRVYATWAGWIQGVPFAKERPLFAGGHVPAAIDQAARWTTWALVLLAALLGVVFLREPGGRPAGGAGRYDLVYGAVVLLPVLMSRYTWPTHYLMAAPALVFVACRGVRRPGVLVFFAGTALFYAAHAKPLQIVGEAGCLLLACVTFLALLLGPLCGPRRRPLHGAAQRKAVA